MVGRSYHKDMSYEHIIDRLVNLPTYFSDPVRVESVRPVGDHYKLRIRKSDGYLDEIVLTSREIQELKVVSEESNRPVDAELLSLLVESHRIRYAFSYDPYFAVSLSGIRTLPHQIEAVYEKMLPQPRLRFLLADDPGAGKTIMAGLLVKEMKLRYAIEKILILVPAALTIQWQDELLRFFNEFFMIVGSELDRQQAISIWQKENQIITSLDYAKQEDVRERVWLQKWDMVIIDEAHKCSAYTRRRSNRSPEAEKTKRYILAEQLALSPNHLLLLTATPHHGDDDRFSHFLRLIDPDLFPEPHKFQEESSAVRKFVFQDKDNPWILRRLKENLCDINGKRLFTERHSVTVPFKLSIEEYELYEAVTNYLNRFLVIKGTGKERQSIALTRTVFQRRLASSTFAIFETLKRRLQKQKEMLDELESLSPADRRKRLERMRGKLVDEELDEGDLDEQEEDRLLDEFTTSLEIDQLKEEISNLKDLVEQAKRIYEQSSDTKLKALEDCLKRGEFSELRDGRGKLLLFTEHRDTLTHIKNQIEKWQYLTCEIHGAMDIHQRKRAQEDFRTTSQICVATEAAGEGINLQFCHLIINYDIPWNPTRLEQRLGRIHRIGQTRDVYAFNFVADEAINGKPIVEGKVLRTLLDKLERMRAVLGKDRVYDVIGEILALNKVDLAEILRDAAYNPHRLEEYLDKIEGIDPDKLRQYEELTGIALAKAYVDFPSLQRSNYLAEEKRLMPEYVEKFFLSAAREVGLKIEKRADGLYRLPYTPSAFRSEQLAAVKKFGKPLDEYRKITFHKEDLERDIHIDAVLLSPGHSLYAVVDEKLFDKLKGFNGRWSAFLDVDAQEPYWLHFLELGIVGEPHNTLIYKELVALKENAKGELSMVPPDLLHDVSPNPQPFDQLPGFDIDKAKDFLMAGYQLQKRQEMLKERQERARVIQEYLEKSFDARIYTLQKRIMEVKARLALGEDVSIPSNLEKELEDLGRTKTEKLKDIAGFSIVRSGPISHIASFFVLPPGELSRFSEFIEFEEEKQKSEKAAMEIVIGYESNRGWEPEDVSPYKLGFDIRSLSPADSATGYRGVRRIEVKGRRRGQPIRLTINEWLKARQLKDTYWLYVVWNPTESDFEMVTIQNPAYQLEYAAKEIKPVSHYEIPAREIERFGGQ